MSEDCDVLQASHRLDVLLEKHHHSSKRVCHKGLIPPQRHKSLKRISTLFFGKSMKKKANYFSYEDTDQQIFVASHIVIVRTLSKASRRFRKLICINIQYNCRIKSELNLIRGHKKQSIFLHIALT